MSNSGAIYFVTSQDESAIRLGYSASVARRLSTHARSGWRPLAVMNGGEDFESRLHDHFRSVRNGGAVAGFDDSTYSGSEIESYVTSLVARGIATDRIEDLEHMIVPPWAAIDPDVVDPYAEGPDGKQRALFPLGLSKRVERAAKQGYNTSLSDEWYTPHEVIEAARDVFGGRIDLDPASCPAANRVVQAAAYYSVRVCGLSNPWHGRVWLNPPYGDLAPKFTEKAADEIAAGRVDELILLLNNNVMTSKWYATVHHLADAFLLTSGRLRFRPGDPAQACSSPNTGSVLVYHGARPSRFLIRFSEFGLGAIPWRDTEAAR